ncbi:hypothetical protein Pcinc_035608 [Petrolisthes cinctipes]|uniref:Reverse transcriptase domain-containing protein n=1 Tax=Petrolisthes cinctipes TaxID=88211 RepID=A0AAE1BWE1_PETCI|nr:hypothetical protein Pcinc_035608 [Petrolisthes cinctipes]
MEIWTEALGHNLPVDIIFMDYAKAFDTVPHERLLAQLATLGIRGSTLSWIRSFLTGREQRVTVNAQQLIIGMEQCQQRCPSGLRVVTLSFHHVRVRCAKPSMFADDTKIY